MIQNMKGGIMIESGCLWCDVHPDEHTPEQQEFCELIHAQWYVEACQRMSPKST